MSEELCLEGRVFTSADSLYKVPRSPANNLLRSRKHALAGIRAGSRPQIVCILLLLLSLVSPVSGQEAAPATQEATTATPSINRLHVESPYLTPYKLGADVDVNAFLFRYVAPGFKPILGPSHKRYVHVLAITNVEGASCEAPLFHWDKDKGVVPDLRVKQESEFLLTFSSHFPDEPEYGHMGEDDLVMTSTGAIGWDTQKPPKDSPEEQKAKEFNKLGRKEKFELLSQWFAPIWPFRPYSMFVTVHTIRGDKKGRVAISRMQPPNRVYLGSFFDQPEMAQLKVHGTPRDRLEVDKMRVSGEVAVITCK